MRRILHILSFVFWRLRLIHVWKRLPVGARRRAADLLFAPPKRTGKAAGEGAARMAPPFHLVGSVSATSSLGWAARACRETLRRHGGTTHVWDVSSLFGSDRQATDALAPDPPEGGTIVFCLNPNQISYALKALPRGFIDGCHTVGYFVWELETIPDRWTRPAELMDEIWAPTTFVAEAFRRAQPHKAIRVVPYDIEVPDGVAPDRPRFGLGDGPVVLCAANLSSGTHRKNLAAAIAAFVEAFARRPDVTLALKLHHDGSMPERRLEVLASLNGVNAVLIEDDLPDFDMWCLAASCDVVLSMHRSEGYGLLLKQGLLLGKRVVATGWSGNVDFMACHENAFLVDYELIPVRDPEGIYEEGNQRWADPSVAHAAALLRDAVDTPEG